MGPSPLTGPRSARNVGNPRGAQSSLDLNLSCPTGRLGACPVFEEQRVECRLVTVDPKRAGRSRSSRHSTRMTRSLPLSQSDVNHHLAG